MILRTLREADHADACSLSAQLNHSTQPSTDPEHFRTVLAHPGTSLLGVEVVGHIRAMLTLHILPNLSVAGRPYALIENVITDKDWRNRGLGKALMNHAIGTAWQADCYKIMLLSGRQTTARTFYEKLGFEADTKWGLQLRNVPTRIPD